PSRRRQRPIFEAWKPSPYVMGDFVRDDTAYARSTSQAPNDSTGPRTGSNWLVISVGNGLRRGEPALLHRHRAEGALGATLRDRVLQAQVRVGIFGGEDLVQDLLVERLVPLRAGVLGLVEENPQRFSLGLRERQIEQPLRLVQL